MSTTELAARKAALRSRMAGEIDAMGPARRAAASVVVCEALRQVLPSEGDVLGFMGLPDEVDLRPLLEELAHAGRLLLPRVEPGDRLSVHVVDDLDALVPGRFGVAEPAGEPTARLPAAVLVPGRAFDLHGGRVGRGKGYYDRYLPEAPRALRAGVGFEVQLVDDVPVDWHDLRVHAVVTEGGVRRCPADRPGR